MLALSVRSIVSGIVIVLFFQCMGALLGSGYRTRDGFRWGFAAYTVTTFSFVTIFTAMNLDVQSISYIDNREFPGNDALPPGPLGYQYLIYSKAISIVPNLMFLMNNWLADGLLVSFVFSSVSRVAHVSLPCSSIVATLSIQRIGGSSPSRAWCTSPLWVCSPHAESDTNG